LPAGTISLAVPGIKATVPALAQVAQEMKSLELGHDDMLVLDLLSISAFIGTDVDRLPSPAYPGEDGTYHIPGSLTAAPAAAIKKILLNSNVIGKSAAAMHSVILIAPIPRYVTGKCCEDTGHVDNYDGEDFESDVIAGVETHKKLL
jgi:hypothetical protein